MTRLRTIRKQTCSNGQIQTQPLLRALLGTVLGAAVQAAHHTVPHIPFVVTLALLVRTTHGCGNSVLTAKFTAADCMGVVAGTGAEAAATMDTGLARAGLVGAALIAPVEGVFEQGRAVGGVVTGFARRSTLRGAVTIVATDG
jgi:hypothetical protein